MKNYFKRLKDHPGLGFAIVLSIASFTAALGNKNIHNIKTALILGGIGSAFIWSMVLISNIKRK